jgi:hypothetical protein
MQGDGKEGGLIDARVMKPKLNAYRSPETATAPMLGGV